jgi:hypothetical protein
MGSVHSTAFAVADNLSWGLYPSRSHVVWIIPVNSCPGAACSSII